MRRRFVILVDPETTPRTASDQITDLLRSLGSWWHRLPHVWLLTTKKSVVTTKALKEAVAQINPDLEVLILRLPPGPSRWSAHGAAGQFKWLTLFWNMEHEPEDQR